MSLRERVDALFEEKRLLMSLVWETDRGSPAWRQMSARYGDIVRELSGILQASLQGKFRVEECVIEKRCAKTLMTNGILSIPVSIRYAHVGLHEFRRPPGHRQAEKRREEIVNLVASEEFFRRYRCEVGAASFEVVEDYEAARGAANIRVIA